MDEKIESQLKQLNQKSKELAAVYHDVANRSGISDNEFWIWYVLLSYQGEFSQQDICNGWSFSKQTVNTIITNLSKNGFVTLEPVPGFGNRKTIRLSESGRKHGEEIVKRVFQAEYNAFTRLSERERQTYTALVGKYISFLKEEIHEE